ncbi:hypothetical protein T01_11027 [Trichinella spiralis]|uniref:Uncharacterized protein n=1 Tax=Trichinella spiralis TaxID=6334 RepID=A0A0V0YVW4_TRISP|nr:hypothetical protein T01_11027 [Trichinella spiralis]
MASTSVRPAQSLCSRSIQYCSADPSASYALVRLLGLAMFPVRSLVRIRLGGPENVGKSLV